MPLFSGRCYSKARLDGKTAIVTGCNTGIGKETVLDFYRRGAHIVMACRNMTKAQEAMKDIKETCKGEEHLGSLVLVELDLNSLASVRQCADQILKTESRIDLLINNAGVMTCPKGTTEDGFETQIGTNHFSHFLFTLLLLPKIIKSTPARIVNVSSKVHNSGYIDFQDINFENRPYSPWQAYTQSKLANILFTKHLMIKLEENKIKGVNVYSLHPGIVDTEIVRHMDSMYFSGFTWLMKFWLLFVKNPKLGAQTTIYCAVDEKCAQETGLYYSDCVAIQPSQNACNKEQAAKLWDLSVKAVGLENFQPFVT